MKNLFILVFLFVSIFLLNKLNAKDSTKIKSKRLKIEVGYPTSIFLGKNSLDFFKQKEIYRPFKDYYPPFIITTSYINNNDLLIGLGYNYYTKSTSVHNRKEGEIINITSHVFDIFFGKLYIKKHLIISPLIILSYRPSGYEGVFYTYLSGTWVEPVIHTYHYNSFGTGIRINFSKNFYNGFIASVEPNYYHFFEKKEDVDINGVGDKDFYNTYKANKDILSIIIKVGYSIIAK